MLCGAGRGASPTGGSGEVACGRPCGQPAGRRDEAEGALCGQRAANWRVRNESMRTTPQIGEARLAFESKPISPQRKALRGALPIATRVGISVAITSAQKNVLLPGRRYGENRIKKTGGKKLTRRHGRGGHQVFAGARRGLIKCVRKTVEWRTGMTAIQNRTKKSIDFAVFPFRLFCPETRKGWR